MGKKRTKEQRKNISLAHIGIQAKEKHPMWGKKHTKEAKKKMSLAKKGFKHSEDTKRKMSKSRSGENNYFWKGGISFSPYAPSFNNKLKEIIRERDNYTCQNPSCNVIYRNISCHHIDYDKLNSSENNLICLCSKHHGQTNSYREFWQFFYEEIMDMKNRSLKFRIIPVTREDL